MASKMLSIFQSIPKKDPKKDTKSKGRQAIKQIVFEPNDKVRFKPVRNDTKFLVIKNESEQAVMFKVRVTSGECFKCKPSRFILEMRGQQTVQLRYVGPKKGKKTPCLTDRWSIMMAHMTESNQSLENLWKEHEKKKRFIQRKYLPIRFEGFEKSKKKGKSLMQKPHPTTSPHPVAKTPPSNLPATPPSTTNASESLYDYLPSNLQQPDKQNQSSMLYDYLPEPSTLKSATGTVSQSQATANSRMSTCMPLSYKKPPSTMVSMVNTALPKDAGEEEEHHCDKKSNSADEDIGNEEKKMENHKPKKEEEKKKKDAEPKDSKTKRKEKQPDEDEGGDEKKMSAEPSRERMKMSAEPSRERVEETKPKKEKERKKREEKPVKHKDEREDNAPKEDEEGNAKLCTCVDEEEEGGEEEKGKDGGAPNNEKADDEDEKKQVASKEKEGEEEEKKPSDTD